ncbi:OadG family protein [Pseudoalteromonas sp. MM17-2]|uniref:OadG family protein n=1 Tax=Pseudoalteromonas sp. MM17-2 TaxID=2917753 RepID=UPI001EF70F9E|nr:OadG family transporter subunit [Pseudoalteromonas sp. MM17-2]MCG7544337.1 OadG family protein [Pseudoalteromonas sp. MM17-2]
MDITALLIEAAWLMATGMVVVFVFLLILIGALRLMSYIFADTEQAQANQQASATTTHRSKRPSKAHIAAIAAAVHQYKKQ